MKKAGRNDPCPCGSGKKYKNCHMLKQKEESKKNRMFIIGAIIALFVLMSAIGVYLDSQKKATGAPPGPAPPGKVWSEEHGHYH